MTKTTSLHERILVTKENKPYYIEAAKTFAENHRSAVVFRALKYFTRCSDDQLDFLIQKIYCSSIPSFQQSNDGFIKTYVGIVLLPIYLLIRKKWLWGRAERTVYNFETTDPSYFYGRFSGIYEQLMGSKRITPRDQGFPAEQDVTDFIDSTVHVRSLLLSMLMMPLVLPFLFLFCSRNRINIINGYRHSIVAYALFDGYFRRYPCDHYITYADESNHPSRYIAFHQNCAGHLIVIQNGERSFHPTWAFGMADIYFVFGSVYISLVHAMAHNVREIVPVGSLALNQHFNALRNVGSSKEYDILYIDNGSNCPPYYGGLIEEVAKSEEKIFFFLNQFKTNHKDYRIGFQLRPYGSDLRPKKCLVSLLNKYFVSGIEILENSGKGESYQNIMKSRLILTFNSTMGFEAMMLRKKALFINYSGYPGMDMCDDARFQLTDEPNYGKFKEKIIELFNLELEGIPEAALNRHFAFDGHVQERIADYINGLSSHSAGIAT